MLLILNVAIFMSRDGRCHGPAPRSYKDDRVCRGPITNPTCWYGENPSTTPATGTTATTGSPTTVGIGISNDADGHLRDDYAPIRHVSIQINKSKTFRLDQPLETATAGSPDIVDAVRMSDRSLYIRGKQVGDTNVSLFDNVGRLLAVFDVQIAPEQTNRKPQRRHRG
jgi:Flp pilus assembly secretin CpaC